MKIFKRKAKANNKREYQEKYTRSTLPVLLRNPRILLIGGGSVAYQKAKVLEANNIDFKIIAAKINEDIKSLRINVKLKEFSEPDLKGFNTIIDATGNPKINAILKES